MTIDDWRSLYMVAEAFADVLLLLVRRDIILPIVPEPAMYFPPFFLR